MKNTAVTSYYSARTIFLSGLMPPLNAPDRIWREWFRLRAEAGEVSPIQTLIEEGAL